MARAEREIAGRLRDAERAACHGLRQSELARSPLSQEDAIDEAMPYGRGVRIVVRPVEGSTSTGTMRSTPCNTEYVLNGPPTLAQDPIEITHFGSGI